MIHKCLRDVELKDQTLKKRVIRLRSKERKILHSIQEFKREEELRKAQRLGQPPGQPISIYNAERDFSEWVRHGLIQLESIVNQLREIGVPPLEEAASYADQYSLEKVLSL